MSAADVLLVSLLRERAAAAFRRREELMDQILAVEDEIEDLRERLGHKYQETMVYGADAAESLKGP